MVRQQGAVGGIDAPCGVSPVGDGPGKAEDVPLDRRPAGRIRRDVAPFVVGVPAAFRAGIGEGEGVCRRGG